MRVLHVAESAKGGVGTYLDSLIPPQIEALGTGAVRVVVPAEHRAQLASAPEAAVRTYPRPDRSSRSLCALGLAVAEETARLRPDVVHAHSTFAGLVVRTLFAAAPRRPRLVYCPHGWGFDVHAAPWKTRVVAELERVMARACDRVVAISRHEAAQAHAVGIDPRRVRLVVSGLPEAPPVAPASWPDGRRKVLFVGRLDRQKGVDVLFDAVRPLAGAVSVRVVGEAVADGAAAEPPPGVDLLGWLDAAGVAAQVAAADLIVAPSRWEGFGLVALEAMRAGKPVVASRVGGLAEVVVDGVTGRLIPPGRSDLLRLALLADAPAALAAMGAQARTRFEARFTSARMNAEVLDLYAHAGRPTRRIPLFPVEAVEAAAAA